MQGYLRRPAAPARPAKRRRALLDARGSGWCYLYLAPALLTFIAFRLYPSLAAAYFGTFDWDGIGWPTRFVGLANFQEAAASPYFWGALRNTWLFAAGMVLIQVPVALVLAVVLNDPKLRGRVLYRTLFFLPVVTTSAVIGVVLALLLSPVGGPVNAFLVGRGLVDAPVNFLGAASLALPTIIAVGIWKGLGVPLVYWLAGLQGVPDELYEAARLDGASGAQIVRFITLPMLRPLALTIAGLVLAGSLNVFELVQVMTRGGPFFASDVMGTFVFRTAFGEESVPRFGYASAAGTLFGLTNLLIVAAQVVSALVARRRNL